MRKQYFYFYFFLANITSNYNSITLTTKGLFELAVFGGVFEKFRLLFRVPFRVFFKNFIVFEKLVFEKLKDPNRA